MRDLDLKVQCPELLQQVSGFPNDGKGTALPEIINEADANQSALRKALGFNDGDTTLELELSTDFDKSFFLSKNIICSMLSEEDTNYILSNTNALWDNKLESGMKISKAIARRVADGSYIDRLSKYMFSLDNAVFKENIRKELPKYPGNMFETLKNPIVFVQNFFSEVAAAKDKKIGFTIDTLMFLRGCNSSNYSSCYTISREYNSMSAISLGLTGLVGMIYLRDGSSILGRCWVVFSPKMTSFNIMKPYGFLKDEVISTVSQWICTLLNNNSTWYKNKLGNENDFDSDTRLDPFSGSVGIYGDPIYESYSLSYESRNHNLAISINLPVVIPRCILCGERLIGTKIFCESCRNTKVTMCRSCNRLMLIDKEHAVQLCDSCISKKEVCPDCGTVHDRDKECTCHTISTSCIFCGNPASLSMNGIAICTSCAESMMKDTCEVCGAHGVMYPYKNKALCQRCFSAVIDRNYYTQEEGIDDKLRRIR